MSTNKLKLKRTPEEEAQRRLRKEKRKKKRKHDEQDSRTGSSSKKSRKDDSPYSHLKWASSDEDEIEMGPQPARVAASSAPPSYAHKPDYDALKAEIEEQRFREKMFDAMGEDERLDSVEARFNDYAQIPERWREASGKSRQHVFEGDEFLKLDPTVMDEEEYAEWIRLGMYRKTHAEEYAEQQRQKAARATRRAEEKARKAETAKLEKVLEEERKERKRDSASRRLDAARNDYNARWAALLANSAADVTNDHPPFGKEAPYLSFDDIPWPIAAAYPREGRDKHSKTKSFENTHVHNKSMTIDDLTINAISTFLLPATVAVSDDDRAGQKKNRKDKLREAFLRFHPDKFEGRFMKKIKEGDQEKTREAIGQISRVLNTLMGDGD